MLELTSVAGLDTCQSDIQVYKDYRLVGPQSRKTVHALPCRTDTKIIA